MFITECLFHDAKMSSIKIYLIKIFPRVRIMDDTYVTDVIHVRILRIF